MIEKGTEEGAEEEQKRKQKRLEVANRCVQPKKLLKIIKKSKSRDDVNF